jgi:uncharacterized spore protein YtfJ
MNEENEPTAVEMDPQETIESLEIVQDTLERFLDAAHVDAVYGKPIENGDTTIIPAAEVLSGMGFGIGQGSGSNLEDTGEENRGSGSGGGGGGRVLSRPVAVIIASPRGVRVDPVIDVTKIALAALTAAGFMTGMFYKMVKGKVQE